MAVGKQEELEVQPKHHRWAEVLDVCSTDACSTSCDEKETPPAACARIRASLERACAAGFALIDAAVRGHGAQLEKVSELLGECLSKHFEQEKIAVSAGKKTKTTKDAKARMRVIGDSALRTVEQVSPGWGSAVRGSAVLLALCRLASSRTSWRPW